MKRIMAMLVVALFLSATTMAQVQPTVKTTAKKAPATEMKMTSKSMKKKPMTKMNSNSNVKTSSEKVVVKKTEKKAVVK